LHLIREDEVDINRPADAKIADHSGGHQPTWG